MQRVEVDATPADEWLAQLNATCNRLSRQYLHVLRSVSSTGEESETTGYGGTSAATDGGVMGSSTTSNNNGDSNNNNCDHGGLDPDPDLDLAPPPALAASVASSVVQLQVAVENINVAAASSLLTLIRILRLSLLLTDMETIQAEHDLEICACHAQTQAYLDEANALEHTRFQELSSMTTNMTTVLPGNSNINNNNNNVTSTSMSE